MIPSYYSTDGEKINITTAFELDFFNSLWFLTNDYQLDKLIVFVKEYFNDNKIYSFNVDMYDIERNVHPCEMTMIKRETDASKLTMLVCTRVI